jgi:PAS domain S-box-containing protein
MNSADQVKNPDDSGTHSISRQIKEPSCPDQLLIANKETLLLHKQIKSLKNLNMRLKKDLQQALEENVFLNELVHGVDALIYINRLNEEGKWEIFWASDKLEELVGFTFEEIKARGLEEHFKDTYYPEHLDFIEDTKKWLLENHNEKYSAVYKKRTKSGDWIWLYIIGHVFKRKPDGRPDQVLSIGLDLTERINTDKQLRDLLNENLRLKNELLIRNLTKREKQVLKFISKGLTNKDIAKKLNISYHTIDSYRKKLLHKLHLKNTAALVRFAVESGLV